MIGRRRRQPKRGAAGDSETLEGLALTLASGLLLGLPFLSPKLFWLHYLALAPWAVLLTQPRRRRAWLLYLLGVFAAFAMAMGPFSALSKLVPFWCSLLVYSPWMVFFALAVRPVYLRWKVPLVLLVPVAWVAAEWLRLRFSIGSVGLFPLAASQARLPHLIQVASLTGSAGVTFVVAAASGALADLWRGKGREPRGWLSLAGFAVLVAVVLAFGTYRIRSASEFRQGPRIAVIQPNEVHHRDSSKARALLDRQLALTRDSVPAGAVDLIALPENTVDFPYGEDPYYGDRLAGLARDRRAAVLAGAFRWAEPGPPALHTSAYYFSAAGELRGVYDKLLLIPWAERLPFEGLERLSPSLARRHAAFAEWILEYPAHGLPGRDLRIFELGGEGEEVRFAVPICFEITSGAFGRRAANRGAELLINISSEGFFGAPLYHHMWALSILRAVENGLAVVRASNNGLSGFIDPLGRTQRILRGRETGRPYLEAGAVLDRPVLAGSPGTAFSRAGDWFGWACLLVAAGLAAASRLRRS